jgi:CheY-like chemotaxis protein
MEIDNIATPPASATPAMAFVGPSNHLVQAAIAAARGRAREFANVTVERRIEETAMPFAPGGSTSIPLQGPSSAGDRHVLVVEDEPDVRRLIEIIISTRFGCSVDTVSHGVDALENLATRHYTLVISDIRMPTMSGTELYLWLREAQPVTARRFVFVTGYPEDNCLGIDIAGLRIPVLLKPFTVERLCELCAPFLATAIK